MSDNRNNPTSQVTEGAKEATRVSKQKRITKQLFGRKSLLTKDIKNVKEKLELYETNFIDDDQPCEIQLEDASEIVRVYNRANTRFLHLESGIEELKASICESSVMTDDEIQKDLEKLDVDLHRYEKNFTDVRKNKKLILGRCKEVLAKSQKAASRSSNITNHPNVTSNNPTFKPQPDLKPVYLAKDCTLLEYITFEKTFISYMKSSQSSIPAGAVDTNIRVHLDPWWYIELKEKGLKST